jgi:hypothetical protein
VEPVTYEEMKALFKKIGADREREFWERVSYDSIGEDLDRLRSELRSEQE